MSESDETMRVEMNGEEVEVRPTEDGFEAVAVPDEPEPGSVEHFSEEVRYEGESPGIGNIDEIQDRGDFLRVKMRDEEHDVLWSAFLQQVRTAGYNLQKVEFEYGYIDVEYEETDRTLLQNIESDGDLYLRAVSDCGNYGAEIPVDANFVLEYDHSIGVDPIGIAFNPEDNRDNSLRSDGGASDLADEHDFDGHAVVQDVSLVTVE